MRADGSASSGNYGHSGRPGKVGGSAPTVSAEGENVPCTGFANEERLNSHIMKHGSEFGNVRAKEYEQKGINFLKQACGGDVVGYKLSDGKVVRFNRKTTEYATGYPGSWLCTYMKAKYDDKKHRIRQDKANEYYEGRKADDLEVEK